MGVSGLSGKKAFDFHCLTKRKAMEVRSSVGACGLADQCWVHKQKVVGSSPARYGQRAVSLSKALYHNYSSRPRCINGYRQCWEGDSYRLVV